MNQTDTPPRRAGSGADRLIYLPLGGAGEIGMNCYVYGYGRPGRERLIVVDLGVTFGDMDTTPGVDLVMPDIAWLRDNRERIEAIFVTHAHEDHVGAVGHLAAALRVPVVARKFTAAMAARKIEETGGDLTLLHVLDAWPASHAAGPFTVSIAPISHSIPESGALVIDTPAGRIVHSGDFKIDEAPVVGEPFDRAFWRRIGDEGVHALVCDSTNVFSPLPGRSESTLGAEIERLVAGAPGMLVATTFASNVARVKTLAEAGTRAGRSVCLLGRAMRRMIETAVETGVLSSFPATIPPEEAAGIPRQNLLLVVTGSQGERRAASAQLARGKHMGIELKAGDTFLFSSKTIPGNERDVGRIANALSAQGVDVIRDGDGRYHVSGHANRPDLAEMHALLRPRIVVPMHGEHLHLTAHAALARESGAASIVAPNGTLVDLTGATPDAVDFVETARLYLDGTVLIGALDGVIRDRIRMALNGQITLTVILEEDGTALGDPWADAMGLPERGVSGRPLVDAVEEAMARHVAGAGRKALRDDERLEEDLRRIARQVVQAETGKRPEVTVVISRLG